MIGDWHVSLGDDESEPQNRPLRLRCRKTGKTYTMKGEEPCPFCGAPIHGLDLSRLNDELKRLSGPLPKARIADE